MTPTASVTIVIRPTITVVDPTRAATYAHRGSGVPCIRLSTPSSRRIAVPIAMLTNVVAITP